MSGADVTRFFLSSLVVMEEKKAILYRVAFSFLKMINR
jgi:hypothetical protein